MSAPYDVLSALEKRLGYTFHDPTRLKQALIHRSYLNETAEPLESNERYEFLGDAVLELIVSDLLFHHFSKEPEGALTNMRARLVCEASFAWLAAKLDLGQALWMGRGEAESGGRKRPSILADTFEAVCGAIYLDGGMDWLRAFIFDAMQFLMQRQDAPDIHQKAPKTAWQEKMFREHHHFHYETTQVSGPEHARRFTVQLYVEDQPVATGHGSSRKNAEQDAAAMALSQEERPERR